MKIQFWKFWKKFREVFLVIFFPVVWIVILICFSNFQEILVASGVMLCLSFFFLIWLQISWIRWNLEKKITWDWNQWISAFQLKELSEEIGTLPSNDSVRNSLFKVLEFFGVSVIYMSETWSGSAIVDLRVNCWLGE